MYCEMTVYIHLLRFWKVTNFLISLSVELFLVLISLSKVFKNRNLENKYSEVRVHVVK